MITSSEESRKWLTAEHKSGNAFVNATDVSAAKTQSGAPVSNANFRTDVNANGTINASDVSTVKSHSGEGLP